MNTEQQKQLLQDIREAMATSLASHIDGVEWSKWDGPGKSIRVTTHPSRDPAQSWNGGEYYYYRRYSVVPGGVVARSDWSCDCADYQYPQETFYPVNRTNLFQIATLAEKLVLGVRDGQAIKCCPCCGHAIGS